MPSGEGTSRGVVGRDAELAVVERFLHSVPDGPCVLLLEGEAGIGKTTLWNRALSLAGQRSYMLLTCRCVESETALPFASLGDLLQEVIDEALPMLPRPQRRALEAALARRAVPGTGPDWQAASVGTLAILRAVASKRSVVVAVDDAQWLDKPSYRVLSFALRRLRDEPLGFVSTTRVDLDGGAPVSIGRVLPEERLERLRMGALDDRSIETLVEERLGTELGQSDLRELMRASGGNPLFALEMARAAVERGVRLSSIGSTPLPDSLAVLVRDRLGGLPPRSRKALLVASALAIPTVGMIERVMGTGGASGLWRAVQAGLVDVDSGHVRFSHPILRSAVYGEAPPEVRRRLHLRVAATTDEPEERARHLALATSRPNLAVAAGLVDAARRARARGAPDAAADLVEQALRLTPVDRVAERRALTVDAAWYRFESGETDRSAALCEEIVATAPPGSVRARALLTLGVLRYHADGMGEAVGLFEQALREGGDDPLLAPLIERHLTYAVSMAGDLEGGHRHAIAAVERSERSEGDGAVAVSLAMREMTAFFLGRGYSEQTIQRALALEDWTEHAPIEWRPSAIHALLLRWTDQAEVALVRLRTLVRRLAEEGDEVNLPVMLFHLSEQECWMGQWDLAAKHADEALSLSKRHGMSAMESSALAARALVDAHRGRMEEAREAGERGLAIGIRAGFPALIVLNLTALAFLDLSLGDHAGVRRRLAPLTDSLAVMGVGDPGVLRFVPDEVEALVALGDVDRAAAILEPFEDRAATLGRTWALAVAARCRAMIHAARGDPAEAWAALDRALSHHRGLAYPFELGRTLLVTGSVERRGKRRAAGRTHLQDAAEIFEELGAPAWSMRARSELDRVGGRARGPSELTPTERRVADLVAMGRTNREVAGELFVAVSTVEQALWKVYRKLGVRSRSELTRLLVTGSRAGVPKS